MCDVRLFTGRYAGLPKETKKLQAEAAKRFQLPGDPVVMLIQELRSLVESFAFGRQVRYCHRARGRLQQHAAASSQQPAASSSSAKAEG